MARLGFALGLVLAVGTVPAVGQDIIAASGDKSALGGLLDRPARLRVREVPMARALETLQIRSGVAIVFSVDFLPGKSLVTCVCDAIPVAAALDRILLGTSLVYHEMRSHVLIEPVTPPAGAPRRSTAPVGTTAPDSTPPGAAEAETIRGDPAPVDEIAADTLAGVVENARGEPLAGARVTLRAAAESRTATTDQLGRFRFAPGPADEARIDVAMIGYRPLSRSVGPDERTLRMVLTEAAVNLNELVVTGTAGETQRRAIGTSVAQIQVTDLVEVSGATSMGQLLNARAPGVVVAQGSGQVGSGPRINIRGQSSLLFPNDPLLYIDGIRVDNAVATGPAVFGGRVASRLNDLSPTDIESIEIIKGPAAATLYGTEASAGVIQVITKKGRRGRSSLNVSIRQGARWFMNPEGRWPTNYWRDPATGQVVEMNLARLESQRGTPMFRTGQIQGYAVSANGGSDLLTYYAGADYGRDEGTEPSNRGDRLSGRLNLTAKPHATVELNGNLGLSLVRTKFAKEDGTGPMFSGLQGHPRDLDTPTRGFVQAPPEVWWRTYDLSQNVNRFTGGFSVNHRPKGPFSQRLTIGLDITDEENVALIPRMSPADAAFFSPADAAGSRSADIRNAVTTTLDYMASLRTGLGESIAATTSVGGQYYGRKTRFTAVSGQGFPAPGVTSVTGAAVRSGSDDLVENVTVGAYVQEQLSFGDRLYLTAAVRGDDNSAFGQDFDFVVYPKVSAAWVISEEPWWQLGFVNTLKLRAAYGASGKQPDAFAAIRTFQPTSTAAGESAVTPQFVGNPSLKPERGTEFEAGFEASLFDQRLDVDFTYFHSRTKDAIISRDVAPSGGFPNVQFVNAGKIETRGVELTVQGLIVNSTSVTWSAGVNVGTNHNEILSLGIPNTPFLARGLARHQPGYPVGSYFLKRIVSAGVDASGNSVNVLCDGGPGQSPLPCPAAPRLYAGSSTPTLVGSVTSTVSLNNRLHVRALVDFKSGNRVFDNTVVFARCFLVRVCKETVDPLGSDPIRVAYTQLGDVFTSDIVASDAKFAKLREVSLQWDVPGRWARSLGARRASITLAGRNLHTWTGYSGLDPESFRTSSNATSGVVDQAAIPQPAQFVTTISFTF